MYIFKTAVVGAGAMGAEIAQVISSNGLPVVLKDIDQQLVDRGMRSIERLYRERVSRGKMTAQELRDKMDLVMPTTSYNDFADVDFAIEAVPENMAVKKAVFAELDNFCPRQAVLASNTSCLSISEMAAATMRPGRVVGFHFFNPASVMKLVEIIPGRETSEETVATSLEFAQSLRKIPVQVKECPGFLVNRVLMAGLMELLRFNEESRASAEEIDGVLREAVGLPMGPFLLADMLGLDVVHDVARTLETAYGDRFRAPATLRKLVENHHLGVKSGEGFYKYTR
ncbi:MAG: 3-hydroxyacyl-CoA dehydrogenase family protein [Chloroflexi bacterium]|nr:3-hydroxyacyl-CoA dehydrogenase family protein [Chloroflexota bacterium]